MSKIIWSIFALLALSACDDKSSVRITSKNADTGSALRVIDALQCPMEQGVLTRRGSATDGGQTCIYVGPRGAEVKVHLVALNGASADDVLLNYQTEMAPNTSKPMVNIVEDADNPHGEQAQVRLPGLSVDAHGDKATVKLPGMRIEADGDRANIRIGGLVIRADDTGSETIIQGTSEEATITANDQGAVIHSRNLKAIRASMMNVVTTPTEEGWHISGYEARGPSGGPMVVATFRSRDKDADDLIEAVKALVAVNVGD